MSRKVAKQSTRPVSKLLVDSPALCSIPSSIYRPLVPSFAIGGCIELGLIARLYQSLTELLDPL